MKTLVKELTKIEPRKPSLLEGFPGLGYIGKINISYLVKQLNAKKFAELYSPFFPNHVITNNLGGARLPRGELYFWKNPVKEKDIIFLTTDTQAQTIEGQYEVVDSFLDFAEEKKVVTLRFSQQANIARVVLESDDNSIKNSIITSLSLELPPGRSFAAAPRC